MQQQGEAPASLAIGTQVSAKYKGAFCEAKVRSVQKQVKCRVTFKLGLGSTTLSDEYVRSDNPLYVGANVTARHPEKQEYLEATVNKIQDQSQYTVVFDDGDITTLRRNALCMKSGKHYNASESLDNLPLTHPEHFSTPVGGRRRRPPNAGGESDADYDSSSDNEDPAISSTYLANVGRVVCIENSDKKSKQPKDSWFPALIVAPAASGTVRIDTKEEFLVRSFKDGRYYTVTKKDTTRFHRDASKKVENAHLKDAMEKAVSYIEKGELPPHWDKETLFKMGDDSTTESSESESLDDEEDDESPEEKDHLVAELYKHMEDRGAPINKTPSIGNKDVDLYKLFRIVFKLGGHVRVTNNSLWRQVALKLGFETTWCINQVRVHYKRYLQSFEEFYRTLGCTMRNHPRSRRQSGSSSSNRAVIRGKHRSGGGGSSKTDSSSVDVESDKSSISSQDDKLDTTPMQPVAEKDQARPDEEHVQEPETAELPDVKTSVSVPSSGKRPKSDRSSSKEKTTPVRPASGSGSKKEEPSERPPETTPVKKGRILAAVAIMPTVSACVGLEMKEEVKMTTRPRRDSTSSLAAAMQVKAQKDNIGDDSRRPVVRVDRDKETENEARKLQLQTKSTKISKDEKTPTKPAREEKAPLKVTKEEKTVVSKIVKDDKVAKQPPVKDDKVAKPIKEEKLLKDDKAVKPISKEEKVVRPVKEEAFVKEDSSVDGNISERSSEANDGERERSSKKRFMKRKTEKETEELKEGEDKQHLAPNVEVLLGDKIKVFYKLNNIYEAKVIKTEDKPDEKYPRYLVHYQGWNARYDEWIKRGRIAENLSWNKDRERQKGGVTTVAVAALSGPDAPPLPPSPAASLESKKEVCKPAARKDEKVDKEQQSPVPTKDKSATRSKAKLLLTPKSSDATAAAAPPKPDTPTSSRTSSRTGSPAALKRQSSRTSIKKESESDEESDDVRKSARLHQPTGVPSSSSSSSMDSSRRSVRKRPHGKAESETEEVDIEKDFEKVGSDSSSAKAKRGRKSTPSKPSLTTVGAQLAEDSSSEDKSGEPTPPPRPRRGTPSREKANNNKQSATTPKSKDDRRREKPRLEDEEDPYAFKEPEPFDDVKFEAPRGKVPSPKKSTTGSSFKEVTDDSSEGEKGKESPRMKRESNSTDSGSDETSKRTRSRPKGKFLSDEDFVSNASDSKQDSSSAAEEEEEEEEKDCLLEVEKKDDGMKTDAREARKEMQGREVETCKPPGEPGVAEAVVDPENQRSAGEAKAGELTVPKPAEAAAAALATLPGTEGKSLLQMTKKQQELFPYLSAIRTTTVADMSNRSSSRATSSQSSAAAAAFVLPPKTAAETASTGLTEPPAHESLPCPTVVTGKVKSPYQSPPPAVVESVSKSYSRQKIAKKRKTPRKPNSSEIVESESESDSGGGGTDQHAAAAAAEENVKSEAVSAISLAKSTRGGKKNASELISNPSDAVVGKKPEESEGLKEASAAATRVDKKKAKKEKEEPQDDLDLACAETIPGSPVHPSSAAEAPTPPKLAKQTANRLEMPFASVPESIHGPAPQAVGTATAISTGSPASLPVTLQPPRKNFSEEDEETPDTLTSASQSPREARKDGSKSPAESSEVDMDSLSGRKAESEDLRLDVEGDTARRSWKRKTPSSPAASAPQVAVKRKRNPREAALRGGGSGVGGVGRGGRGRHGSGRFGNASSRGDKGHEEETDDGGEEAKDPTIASIGSLDNDALAALSRRSPRSSKYNFFVDLDPGMDSATRISRIQTNLEDLRKTYTSLKGELAVIERRRKKIRKKERERSEKECTSGGGSGAAGNPIEATA